MKWTTPGDLRAQVQRLWDRGVLLAELAGGAPIFPKRLILKSPTSTQMVEHFSDVRRWIAGLQVEAKYFRLVWRTINHRTLGTNQVPAEVWIDTLDDALGFIGRRPDARRFASVIKLTQTNRPALVEWLKKRPMQALTLADHWEKLLAIVQWLEQRPRPGVYLRQVDIPGVHTKFIENHRAVLSQLFDLALPEGHRDLEAPGGISGFCQRYGFRDKPEQIRFRLLDSQITYFDTNTDQDITVTHDTFAALDPPVRRVFITENQTNFLAFPDVRQSLVIFGAGYGFDRLAQATWLHNRHMVYWGDIDTHGFAILDQLRAHFPNAESLLMDRNTLMAHQSLWGTEHQPQMRDLKRLSATEKRLYDDLRYNRLGDKIRLEQEHIGFGRVLDWVSAC